MGDSRIFVKALVVFNRKVLIIRRSGYSNFGKCEWDIPGGGIQFGEDLLDGLHREVREETGLTVRVDRLIYATTLVTSPDNQVVGLAYLCHTDTDAVILSHEHTDYLWATKEQLRARLSKSALDIYTKNSVFDILNID